MRQAGHVRRAAGRHAGRGVVVVVGASVRAFAESAARAGWSVHAADLFADLDLRRVADHVVRVTGRGPRGYPDGLPAAIERFPPGPCVYTGGLENHPAVIDAIAAARPLAGNRGGTVRAVRDHARLAAAVRGAGLRFPETVTHSRDVPTDGSFLVKPAATAGGRGIARWRGRMPPRSGGPMVWQRLVAGESWAAAFVAGAAGCRLLAASRQLTGMPWCGARPFAYCGSIDVPLADVPDRVRRDFERAGRTIAAAFGVVGLFGIDAVVDARSGLHVIEVNPRPTASMELLERATGVSLAALHLEACGCPGPATRPPRPRHGPGVWSKAVVFARGPCAAVGAARLAAGTRAWSDAAGAAAVADVPRGGATLPARGPLVTVFACGDTAERSLAILRTRAAAIRRLFAAAVRPPSAAAASRPRPPRARTA